MNAFFATNQRLRSVRLPDGVYLDSHRVFLQKTATPDGLYPGRKTHKPDIYYTLFGLRSLALLGSKQTVSQETLHRLSRDVPSDMPHLYALIASLAMLAPAEPELLRKPLRMLASLRSGDGFRRTEENTPSLYATFLGLLALREAGGDIQSAETDRLMDFVLRHATPDGGFSSLQNAKTGMTSQTAAAIAILDRLDRLDRIDRDRVIRFYQTQQDPDGGFFAGDQAPIPDLLSTFTACVSLHILDSMDRVETEKALDLIQHLQCPGGGFSATLMDVSPDTEYTYYGLATLTLVLS
jgi:geranylgeranyl transferase type-2 subunit beta